LDWFVAGDEYFKFGEDLEKTRDTLLFGRHIYEGMASYWTSAEAMQNDPKIANQMNTLKKVVFSKTLDKADWQNTTLIKGDLGEEVHKLKAAPGGDMLIFGSGHIVSKLTELGLIDIYRIFINPVILGQGKPEFPGLAKSVKLKLLGATPFSNGTVALEYVPET